MTLGRSVTRALARRRLAAKVRNEVKLELESHLEERTEWYVEQGYDRETARREAEVAFGDLGRIREECRRLGYEREGRMDRRALFGSVWADAAYAVRSARKQPGFTAALVLTLALGIGANVAIYSVVDALLLRPLPFREPDRLFSINPFEKESGFVLAENPMPAALALAEAVDFMEISLYSRRSTVRGDREFPEYVSAVGVSPGLFHQLGVSPLLGRALRQADAGTAVAVVSYATWRGWGGDASILGSDIQLDQVDFTVVGVMPAEFKFPTTTGAEVWVPLGDDGSVAGTVPRGAGVFGRLSPAVRIEEAQGILDGLAAGLVEERPDYAPYGFRISPLDGFRAGADVKRALWMILGAVSLMLLVAAINAVNLLLARNVSRSRELAIRLSLGCSPRRLARQLLTETLLNALAGGLLSVGFAWFAVSWLTTLMPTEISRFAVNRIALDGGIYLYAFSVSFGLGLGCGLVPAIGAVRSTTTKNLNALGSIAGTARSRKKLGQSLVVVEVAASVMLLLTAGLMVRSFIRLVDVDPGFDVDRILAISLQLPASRYPDGAARLAFYDQLREELDAIPGVVGVTRAMGTPTAENMRFPVALETEDGGRVPGPMPDYLTFARIDPAYLDVFGSRIVAGRGFDRADHPRDRTVVIDLDLAHALWGNNNALGRTFRVNEDGAWYTVVGVIDELKLGGLDSRESGDFSMFHPIDPDGSEPFMQVVVRTERAAAEIIEDARRAVTRVDANQPTWSVEPLSVSLRESIGKQEFYLILMAIFAGTALTLAAVGVHGVLSFNVVQESRDTAIRIALGARRRAVLLGILARGIGLAAVGGTIGLAVAAWLSGLVETLLFETGAADPVAITAVLCTMIGAAALASYVPARRAMGVDPVAVLKAD